MNVIVRIVNIRCGEPDSTVYIGAPEEWVEEVIEHRMLIAQRKYLEALDWRAANDDPPNEYRPGARAPYEAHPDRLVSEVTAEWEQKKQAWELWRAKQKKQERPFVEFLLDEGFRRIYDVAEAEMFLDWGHRHGQRLDYDWKPEDV